MVPGTEDQGLLVVQSQEPDRRQSHSASRLSISPYRGRSLAIACATRPSTFAVSQCLAVTETYNERWAELEASDSPFAIVVMSHLKARATHGDDLSRLGDWCLLFGVKIRSAKRGMR